MENIKEIFDHIDWDKDGKVNQDDIVNFFDANNYSLYQEQIYFIWNRLDPRKKNKLTLRDFLVFFSS